MARSSTRCSPYQNPHDSKNKLIGGTPTKSSDRRTPDPAATCAFTPAAALSLLRLLLLAPPTSPWLDIWRITSSGSSGPFWILDLLHLFRPPSLPPLYIMKAHVNGFWKLGSQTFIRVKLTWSITISSRSAKITLSPLVPWARTEFRLQLPSWKISPCSNGSNTSVR